MPTGAPSATTAPPPSRPPAPTTTTAVPDAVPVVTGPSVAPATRYRGSDFADLVRQVRAAGLLGPRAGRYYAGRSLVVLGALAAGWAVFAGLGASWWQLGVAGFLAVCTAQVGLLAHDVAHRQVFPDRTRSDAAGLLLGNVLMGMSYGWWMDKHTRHHAHPNHVDRDPDVAPDLLVWSAEQAESSRGLARVVGRWQGVLFFPMLTMFGWSLKVSSVRALSRGVVRRRGLEGVLLAGHTVAFLAAALAVLGPVRAVAFVVVHQAVLGVYLGSVFAPNHKGMPLLGEQDRLDFLRRQVRTSRNVTGGRWVDAAFGGLNLQVEHHLFPGMPMPHLRRARPIVQRYCAELGI
ncbi:MAG: acyl-CoA desaturase, partial [Phycicoccus sp.]